MADTKYVGMMFSGESIQQIVAGNKTQTRRPVKDRRMPFPSVCTVVPVGVRSKVQNNLPVQLPIYAVNPPCKPGDIIYVKEAWRLFDSSIECSCYDQCGCARNNGKPMYKSDNPGDETPYKSPMYMPKAAARHFLEVVDVRVERLQDISPADAIAEGIKGTILLIGDEPSQTEESYWHYIDKRPCGKKKFNELHDFWFDVALSSVESYATMWDHVNSGKNRPKWADNPLVFAITFRYLENHKSPFQ